MTNMANKVKDVEREVQHREEMIERLTNEITALQEELTKSHDKIADYESNVQRLRSKLEQRVAEVRLSFAFSSSRINFIRLSFAFSSSRINFISKLLDVISRHTCVLLVFICVAALSNSYTSLPETRSISVGCMACIGSG